MAASTATMPLTMAMMTPAMALITVIMHAPMAWKQETTAPMFAVLWLLDGDFVLCRCVKLGLMVVPVE